MSSSSRGSGTKSSVRAGAVLILAAFALLALSTVVSPTPYPYLEVLEEIAEDMEEIHEDMHKVNFALRIQAWATVANAVSLAAIALGVRVSPRRR